MSVLTLEAKLERTDANTQWGFRMQGGKDFSSPLTIQRVNPGSLAAKCGLQAGDIILKIGNVETEHLVHKKAQEAILSYGNKLDLLLQRGGPGAPVGSYEKFQPPAPVPSPMGITFTPNNQNFNVAPKPFGAPQSYSSNVESVTQKTQNMTINSQPDYQGSAQKYSDREEAPNPSQTQSRSFKYLQDLIEAGHDPPKSLKPLNAAAPSPGAGRTSPHNDQAGSPAGGRVKAILPNRYNTPIGLYSQHNVESTFRGQSKFLLNQDGGEDGEGVVNPPSPEEPEEGAQGPRKYFPSETYKLVHQAEEAEKKPQDAFEPAHSRTFKLLQQQLGTEEEQRGTMPPSAPSTSPKNAPWQPPAPKAPPQRAPPPAPVAKPWAPSGPPAPPAAPPAPMGGPRPGAPTARPTSTGVIRGKRGDAVFKQQDSAAARTPICASCGTFIRGPFVVALGKTWCPDHFVCANPQCRVKLIDIGFVEENGQLYCEKDYEMYFAPRCFKCSQAIIGECVNALQRSYHPSCFLCFKCRKPIGGNQFHIEEGEPYCEADWAAEFQTMCSGCNYPIEPGDKWVEAMSRNFHSECFNCSTCQVNLEGAPFFVKGGKQYCKKHAR